MEMGKVKDVHKDSSVMATFCQLLLFYHKPYDICCFPVILAAIVKESEIA